MKKVKIVRLQKYFSEETGFSTIDSILTLSEDFVTKLQRIV